MHLAFETVGDASRPAVLLLHGFMSSNAQWLANRDALAERYRLVLVELWGHGRSPLPAAERFTIDAYCAEFERLRTVLGVGHWAMVGQSYGAGLALHYAERHPQRCAAVIVTNSRSAFGRVGDVPRDGAPDPLRAPDLDPRTLPYHPIHARRFPEHVKAALVAAADAMTPEAIRRSARLGARLRSVELLAQIEAPVLVANGRHERAFQQDLAALLERYPALEVAHLEGGHSVNIEAAVAFDRAVLAFLDRHLTP